MQLMQLGNLQKNIVLQIAVLLIKEIVQDWVFSGYQHSKIGMYTFDKCVVNFYPSDKYATMHAPT